MEKILVAFWVFYGAIIAMIGMAVTGANDNSAGAVGLIAMACGAILSFVTVIFGAPLLGYKIKFDPDKDE